MESPKRRYNLERTFYGVKAYLKLMFAFKVYDWRKTFGFFFYPILKKIFVCSNFFNQIKSFSFVRLFLKVFHLNKQKIFFEKFFDYWRTGCETLTFFTMCFKDIDSNLERVER